MMFGRITQWEHIRHSSPDDLQFSDSEGVKNIKKENPSFSGSKAKCSEVRWICKAVCITKVLLDKLQYIITVLPETLSHDTLNFQHSNNLTQQNSLEYAFTPCQ